MAPYPQGEPDPHYCTHPRAHITEGCPNWPACVVADLETARRRHEARGVARVVAAPLDPEPPARAIPAIGRALAWLLGIAAGIGLALVVAGILVVYFETIR